MIKFNIPYNLTKFKKHLILNEKSKNTVQKYLRDVKKFLSFCGLDFINKDLVLNFKNYLSFNYKTSSANSIISSLNCFFKFIGKQNLAISQIKVQKNVFCSKDKELSKFEYLKLVNSANSSCNHRLSLILQTICGTGIRVSELKYITIDAATCGKSTVFSKGKTRTFFIVKKLQKMLLSYIKQNNITYGSIFVTKNGKPVNRSNVWRDMKKLCKSAGVSKTKVFPHNLRHLFAKTFYKIDKDISKLADLLGHSSINTTRIYIMSSGEEHRRKMEKMHLIL